MRHLYLVTQPVFDAVGSIPAAAIYDLKGGWHLLVVEQWLDHTQQDQLEAYPETAVITCQPWDYARLVPNGLVAAMTGNKVVSVAPTDTIGSALWKVRALCPAARP